MRQFIQLAQELAQNMRGIGALLGRPGSGCANSPFPKGKGGYELAHPTGPRRGIGAVMAQNWRKSGRLGRAA